MSAVLETARLQPLVLDLVAWIDAQPRTIAEVMEAWGTSCPQLPVWETACAEGLVARETVVGGVIAAVTPQGRRFLDANRRTGPNLADRVRLRRAVCADAALLAAWRAQSHVAEAVGNEPWWDWGEETARDVGWRELLIGEEVEAEGERPVGFVQILDPARADGSDWGETATGRRAAEVWIGEVAELGQGVGTRMMRLAHARCFAAPEVSAVIVDPLERNQGARRFYERLGYRPLGRRTMQGDAVFLYELTRADWRAHNR